MMTIISFMRYELPDSILNEIQSSGRQSIEPRTFFAELLLFVYLHAIVLLSSLPVLHIDCIVCCNCTGGFNYLPWEVFFFQFFSMV